MTEYLIFCALVKFYNKRIISKESLVAICELSKLCENSKMTILNVLTAFTYFKNILKQKIDDFYVIFIFSNIMCEFNGLNGIFSLVVRLPFENFHYIR